MLFIADHYKSLNLAERNKNVVIKWKPELLLPMRGGKKRTKPTLTAKSIDWVLGILFYFGIGFFVVVNL